MGEEFSGVWVIVFSQGKGFLGRVVCLYNDEVPLADPTVKSKIVSADVLRLDPVFDFFSPLRPMQTPQGQIAYARDPVVTTFDFAMQGVPLYVKPSAVAFFDDMKEEDLRLYQGLIRDAMRQQVAERVKRSGLVTP